VDLVIAVGSKGARDLPDLYAWLRQEDEFRGNVRIERRALDPDKMGAIPELIAVAVGSGGAASVLARSLSTWLAHRKSDVTLRITSHDGRTVELNAQRVTDVNELLHEVLQETRSTD
jgi:hypothetical protein